MMNEKYKQDVAKLIETSPKTWAWIRARASFLYTVQNNYDPSTGEGDELEGSSDVSGYVYNLWQEYQQAEWDVEMPQSLANMGFWINGLINEAMDIPNTRATREYHNPERA